MADAFIKSISFRDFKTFARFDVSCRRKNVLVGPNNSGKSSTLDALRICSTVVRYCRRTKGKLKSQGDDGVAPTYWLPQTLFDLEVGVCVRDFEDDTKARIEITLHNKNRLVIIIDQDAPVEAYLSTEKSPQISTEFFRREFPVEVVVVPTLSPLEQDERYVERKTVDRNEFTRLGSRNFRNAWLYKSAEQFQDLDDLVANAWGGIRLHKPETLGRGRDRIVHMQFRDGKRVREVQWSGFGFQVWMQTMSHLLRCDHNTIFVLDEPDVYLHPDLQHKLVKNVSQRVGQFFIATHSSEIINEFDAGDVVMVRPGARSAKRVKSEADYGQLFGLIGSSENAQFARLARTKKILYFEGNDRKIIRKIGERIGHETTFSDGETTYMKTDGFQNWERISSTEWVFNNLFDFDVCVAAIFDRDYRCDEEIEKFEEKFRGSSLFCRVLPVKEIENLLLAEGPVLRAVARHIDSSEMPDWEDVTRGIISSALEQERLNVLSNRIGERTRFFTRDGARYDPTTIANEETKRFEQMWADESKRVALAPGKAVFSNVCNEIRSSLGVSLTSTRVANEMKLSDIPEDVTELLSALADFLRNTD